MMGAGRPEGSAGVAVVTGASAGIGAAIADRLLSDGYLVVNGDIQEPSTHPDAIHFRALDVRSDEQVEAFFQSIVSDLGPVRVLVNNAGIQRHAPLETLSWRDWRDVMSVNLDGVFLCLRAAGRHMLGEGRGAIVNIASVAARGAAGRAPYAAAKAAIVALTATAGAEWARHGIRVNAVAPGYVDTGVLHKGLASGGLGLDAVLHRIPAGRLAASSEIADAVSFLASEQSTYLAGQTIHVDGGFSIDYGVPLMTARPHAD